MRRDAAVQPRLAHFSDPEAVKHYAEGPPRFVPGFADLHRMTRILLAEQAAQDAQVLVLGAGGGLELKSLAEAEPGWTLRRRRSRRGDAEAGGADARAVH